MRSPNSENQERFAAGNRVIFITIVLNVFLTIVKVIAGHLGNSTAMIADGFHSASDIATSIGVVLGMFWASKPSDSKHQYGHEKAESIAGFLLAAILTWVGLRIGYQSLKLIFQSATNMPHIYTAWVAAVSIAVKEYQFRIARKAAKELNSSSLMADAWHHRSDAFSSIAALFGIIGARLGYGFLDPLAGMIVSIIIVKVGLKLLLEAMDELMDGAIDADQMQEVRKKILEIQGIINIKEFRARKHGSRAYADITICVDPSITVYAGHDIGKEVEKLILREIISIKEVIVHIDPCEGYLNKGKCSLKECKNAKDCTRLKD